MLQPNNAECLDQVSSIALLYTGHHKLELPNLQASITEALSIYLKAKLMDLLAPAKKTAKMQNKISYNWTKITTKTDIFLCLERIQISLSLMI